MVYVHCYGGAGGGGAFQGTVCSGQAGVVYLQEFALLGVIAAADGFDYVLLAFAVAEFEVLLAVGYRAHHLCAVFVVDYVYAHDSKVLVLTNYVHHHFAGYGAGLADQFLGEFLYVCLC